MKTPISAIFAALAVSLATLTSAPLAAAPAPWYRWASLQTDSEICAQISPGAGWYKALGPFRDSRCERRGRPGENFSGLPPLRASYLYSGINPYDETS